MFAQLSVTTCCSSMKSPVNWTEEAVCATPRKSRHLSNQKNGASCHILVGFKKHSLLWRVVVVIVVVVVVVVVVVDEYNPLLPSTDRWVTLLPIVSSKHVRLKFVSRDFPGVTCTSVSPKSSPSCQTSVCGPWLTPLNGPWLTPLPVQNPPCRLHPSKGGFS